MRESRVYIFIFLLCNLLVFGQTLSSELDQNVLVVGQKGNFKIKISNLTPNDTLEISPQGRLMPFGFEVLKDSIRRTPNAYYRSVEFQIFQVGEYEIPTIEIGIDDKILKTIPYEVKVINTAQKGEEINGLKNIEKVELTWRDYWDLYKTYVFIGLAVLALIVVAVLFYKRIKYRSQPVVANTNQALKQLQKLKKKRYIENEDYRSFYVELIDIVRDFLSKQYHFPAKELLTEDLTEYMKEKKIGTKEHREILEAIFKRGDLAKFAKVIPSSEEMQNDYNAMVKMVKKSLVEIQTKKAAEDA